MHRKVCRRRDPIFIHLLLRGRRRGSRFLYKPGWRTQLGTSALPFLHTYLGELIFMALSHQLSSRDTKKVRAAGQFIHQQRRVFALSCVRHRLICRPNTLTCWRNESFCGRAAGVCAFIAREWRYEFFMTRRSDARASNFAVAMNGSR